MAQKPSSPFEAAKDTVTPRLVINGKFLQPSASRSGVYRVARELLLALDALFAANPVLANAIP